MKKGRKSKAICNDMLPPAKSIEELLGGLKRQQLEVLKLRFVDDKGYVQIAKETGLSFQYIGDLIHSAIFQINNIKVCKFKASKVKTSEIQKSTSAENTFWRWVQGAKSSATVLILCSLLMNSACSSQSQKTEEVLVEPRQSNDIQKYYSTKNLKNSSKKDLVIKELKRPERPKQILAIEQDVASIHPPYRGQRAQLKKLYKAAQPLGGVYPMTTASDSILAYEQHQYQSTEKYESLSENIFKTAQTDPLSTFSIDVDTASYANVRRFLSQGQLPPADAVRAEELINYFNYDYKNPKDGPFSVDVEVGPALWNKNNKLVRIAMKSFDLEAKKRPASNLVFLLDVSGSMNSPKKLPLLKSALVMLVDRLNENDKVSIVVYAGAAGLVLKPTSGVKKNQILKAIDNLNAGGSTNGGAGIQLAYKLAKEQFIKGGVNRVIMATDGDFNVGTTNSQSLIELVADKAKENIYLTILGLGDGNYNDALMEQISNKGNGNYAYIDTHREARKVLVEQISSTLVTIAKDVKIQVEFNPQFVRSYRLVGYENRHLKNADFNNDKKDAGEMGAGHRVTALYEIVPVGAPVPSDSIDALKYQTTHNGSAQNELTKNELTKSKETKKLTVNNNKEWLTLKLRYKKPDADISTKIEVPVKHNNIAWSGTSRDFRFASSVALFAMILKNSQYVQDANLSTALEAAKANLGNDKEGYRAEFVELIESAQQIKSGRISKLNSKNQSLEN